MVASGGLFPAAVDVAAAGLLPFLLLLFLLALSLLALLCRAWLICCVKARHQLT